MDTSDSSDNDAKLNFLLFLNNYNVIHRTTVRFSTNFEFSLWIFDGKESLRA